MADGCGAICPAFGRGCFGWFGPVAAPNVTALTTQLRRLGMTDPEVDRVFAIFNAASCLSFLHDGLTVEVGPPGDQGDQLEITREARWRQCHPASGLCGRTVGWRPPGLPRRGQRTGALPDDG